MPCTARVTIIMYYDLAESGGSQERWLWDIAKKGMNFFCFLLFWDSFNCLITLETLVHVSKWALQSSRKLKMAHVWLRLISLDRITYHVMLCCCNHITCLLNSDYLYSLNFSSQYKILLYISKQQQVTHARITPSFVFTVRTVLLQSHVIS